MRIVWPFRSLSVARGCAQVDSRLDTAKICSNRRVDADRPRLRAVFGGGKTFLHSLGQKRKSRPCGGMSTLRITDSSRTLLLSEIAAKIHRPRHYIGLLGRRFSAIFGRL